MNMLVYEPASSYGVPYTLLSFFWYFYDWAFQTWWAQVVGVGQGRIQGGGGPWGPDPLLGDLQMSQRGKKRRKHAREYAAF